MRVQVLMNPTKSEEWPQVERGLVKALAVETANVSIEEIVEKVQREEIGILVAYDEADTVMGVAVLDEQGDGQGWLDVPILWSAGLASLTSLFQAIEWIAKSLGAKGVKWVTANDKGEIFAARRGYRRRLVEYVKEVQ